VTKDIKAYGAKDWRGKRPQGKRPARVLIISSYLEITLSIGRSTRWWLIYDAKLITHGSVFMYLTMTEGFIQAGAP